MRFFIDTEFVEDGKTIDLISIGIVAEDGREYYAVSAEYDIEKAKYHLFVGPIVLPALFPTMDTAVKSRNEIATEIVHFVGSCPEFWADYASYDWVALCQLFGPMVNLPRTWPMFCFDVEQMRQVDNIPEVACYVEGECHNALHDARDCKARYDYFIAYRGISVTVAPPVPPDGKDFPDAA
jgi:hypothetical protein